MSAKRVGMSQREYAAHAGVSRGAIEGDKRAGRLVLYRDGSINAEASDAKRNVGTDPVLSHRRDADAVPASGDTTFLKARTANEVTKAQERQIRLQKLRGELVSRSIVTQTVFELARKERDAWTTWPARVAAIMAAEAKVDAHLMESLLDRHVREHLAELADVRVDFR